MPLINGDNMNENYNFDPMLGFFLVFVLWTPICFIVGIFSNGFEDVIKWVIIYGVGTFVILYGLTLLSKKKRK
jgi:hypothetical protein